MYTSLLLAAFLVFPGATPVSLSSPSGDCVLRVRVDDAGQLSYSVDAGGRSLVDQAPLGIRINGSDLGAGVTLGKPEHYESNQNFPTRGTKARVQTRAAGVRIPVTHSDSGRTWRLNCRAFDHGVAWRYEIDGVGDQHIASEQTTFRMPADAHCWYFERDSDWKLKTYAGVWKRAPLAAMPTVSMQGPIQGPPLVFELSNGYAIITEAALFNFNGMRLQSIDPRSFRVNFTEPDGFSLDGHVLTPWRVILWAPTLDSLVNNDVVASLAPPPDADLFADTSYIRPGRSVWRWWSQETGTPEQERAYIAHAAALGFEYTTIDEGWSDWPDCWATLRQVCNYARTRNVGVFVWRHWKHVNDPWNDYAALRGFLDRVQQAGAAGVKIDFMNGESLDVVRFNEAVLREAARRKLLVNFHGCTKATGESRTYPNEITREGIRGLELNRMGRPIPPEHNAALPFTRFVVGHGDYTPLTVNPERLGDTTIAHQLATVVAFTSPLQVIAEDPSLLRDPQHAKLLKVLKRIPSTWDETRVLEGSRIGELAVLARRSGTTWFVAGINGSQPRSYRLRMDALKAAQDVVSISDQPRNPGAYQVHQQAMPTAGLPLELSAGGGFVVVAEIGP